MTKCLKMMFYAALTLVFASPTQARVIHLYDLKNWEFFGSVEFGSSDIDGDENATCESKGYRSKRPANMECLTKRLGNGKYCYASCKCSTGKFPWHITDTSFFAPVKPNNKCVDGDATYYKDVTCAASLVNEKDIKNLADFNKYFNTSNAKKVLESRDGSKTLTCYNYVKITCNTGYTIMPDSEINNAAKESAAFTYTVSSKVEPIKYTAYSPASSGAAVSAGAYKACVATTGGVSTINGYSFLNEPTTTRCAQYEKVKAKYSNVYYYYYNGNCKSSSLCRQDVPDCVSSSSETFNTYNLSTHETGNGSCRYIANCYTGWNEKGYFCTWAQSGYLNIPTGVAYSVIHDERGEHDDCIKITGCSSGWEKYAFQGSDDMYDLMSGRTNAAKSDTTVFTVAEYSSPQDPNDNYAFVLCRKATGCKTTNPSGQALCDRNSAWNGWLKCVK